MSRLPLDFGGQGTGFIGSTKSGFGDDIPASSISISGGGQIQTISQWNSDGFQVPVYAYVAAGIPQVTLSTDQGISDIGTPDCSATFVSIGGGETTISVGGVIPDPTQSKTTGRGATFTWIIKDVDDPYGAVEVK